jgi:hypothetical protein
MDAAITPQLAFHHAESSPPLSHSLPVGARGLVTGASRRIWIEAGVDARAPSKTGGVIVVVGGASRGGLNAGLVPRAPGNPTPGPLFVDNTPLSVDITPMSVDITPMSTDNTPMSIDNAPPRILPEGALVTVFACNTLISGEELPHSRFTRRKKELFDFPQEDRGKTIYFCVRYENAKGEPGPWGPIFSAVIP